MPRGNRRKKERLGEECTRQYRVKKGTEGTFLTTKRLARDSENHNLSKVRGRRKRVNVKRERWGHSK